MAIISIACNVNENSELLSRVADERNLPILLLDPEHQVAALYGATTTPHLYVMDRRGMIRYQGAFDHVSFRNRTPTRCYLDQAIEELLHGAQPDPAQTAPYGCAIVRYSG